MAVKTSMLKAIFLLHAIHACGWRISSNIQLYQGLIEKRACILICIPSKIQTRQWFVTNYSNNCCLDCTMHTEDFIIFSLDMNFARLV